MTRIIGSIITIATLVIGLTVGFAIFLVVLGLGAIVALAFFARLYWVRRKFIQRMQQAQRQQADAQRASDPHVIEGEYHVDRTDRQGW
jgi:hypothetical protein